MAESKKTKKTENPKKSEETLRPEVTQPPSENEEQNSTNSEKNEETTEVTIQTLIQVLFAAYGKDATDDNKKIFNETLNKILEQTVKSFNFEDKYNVLILHDEGTLIKSDADKIYNAVTSFKDIKPIILVLLSKGGIPGPAYLIGKLCQEYSKGSFIVTVPRYAKSAATLICCAGNEIHMGSMSELGPIDPQINSMPALGLKNSIEHIAGLVKKYPDSSEMFAKYLNLSIEPIQIGYYERVAESAMQYAENLLMTHQQTIERPVKEISNDLVYKYKDHSFVIEKDEASKIFGSKIIKNNSPEYKFGNAIYGILNLVAGIADYLNYSFYFIGSISSEPNFLKRKNGAN